MAFEGEAGAALRGLGQDGFIRTVKNLTVTGDLVVHGETRSEKGEGTAFWEEADANANYWAYELPAGGATNVPVFGIGQGLDSVDLGLFDGITQTTLAVLDTDRDSFIAVDFSGDDAARMRSNTTINIVPTGALSVGTDGSGNDVIFYSGTSGDNLTWDSSEEVLQITGTNGQTSLDVLDGDVRIVDTLYFYDRGGESMSSDGSTLTIAGSVVFSGSIEVQGTTTTINSSTTVIDDPLFHLGNDNNANSVDLGIFAEYTDSGKKFSGLFRDASDSDKWKLFATSGNSHEEPTTTVNTTSGFTLANLAVNELEGTLATAAQANITSVGTLTALQVDYLNLNASTLQITDSTDTGDLMSIAVTTHGATTLTTTDDDASAADLTLDVDGEIVIDPADAAGTIFKLNGTAQVNIIDGAILPESTNDIDLGSADKEFKDAYFDGTVTSDAFSGPLSGNATTATALATGRTISMTGDVAWTSASFDGSGNVTGAGTIQSGAVETAMLNDNVISGQTELAATGLAAEDELLISDGGTIKKYGVDNLIKDSPALLADTTIADGDFIVFLDGGATGTAKKEALADLVGVMAGTVTSTGLSDANSVLTVDIQNLNATTTVADADLVMIDDGAGGALRKMTRANFIESAALDAINIDGGAIDGVTIGTNSAVTQLVVDNLDFNGNTITATGNLNLHADSGNDVILGDTAANYLFIDGGSNHVSFGATANDNVQFGINFPAETYSPGSAGTSFFRFHVNQNNAVTVDTNDVTTVASMYLEEPNITESGVNVTNAVTLYVGSVASEATNNYAIWVDAGDSRFDGDVLIADDLSLNSDSAVFNMGAGNDFTITHDGTTGATIAGNPITITSAANSTWSVSSGNLTLYGANLLKLEGSSRIDVGDPMRLTGNNTLTFGDNSTHWHVLQTSTTPDEYQFWASDVDGSDTDGIVYRVPVGGDDIYFKGNIGFDAATTMTANGGTITLDENVKIHDGDLYLDNASGQVQLQFQNAGTYKFIVGMATSSNQFFISTTDSDGSGTDKDVIRIPIGQATVDFDATADENAFDDYDDAMVLAAAYSPTAKSYELGKGIMARGKELLADIGILRRYDDGWLGYAPARMDALMAGAIYQSRETIDLLSEKVKALEAQVKSLKGEK
jgi:hypothetical protein